MAVAAFLWLIPSQPMSPTAHATTLDDTLPTLQVNVGFDDTYRDGYWTPVAITMQNQGPDFNGTLVVRVASGTPRTQNVGEVSPWSFEQAVTLPKETQQQITFYVPFTMGNFSPGGVLATLRNTQGKTVEQPSLGGLRVKPNNLFIGLLTDPNLDFSALTSTSLLHQTDSPTTSALNASNMPTIEAVLENFDMIILDDFDSKTLKPSQLAALQTWVNQGGILLEVGGKQWQRTLGPLPSNLLPITLTDTALLPAGTHAWPFTGPTAATLLMQGAHDTLPAPTFASTGTPSRHDAFSQNETLLTSGGIPLIQRARQGQGAIYYIAFDIGEPQLTSSWSGLGGLWTLILTHAFGDKMMIAPTSQGQMSGPGRLLTHGGILDMIEPAILPLWAIGTLLAAYVLTLGPVRLLLVRRLKLPRWWRWRIFAATVVLFSSLTFGLALYQKSVLFNNNTISLIQINQGGTSAHSITYMGMFAPSGGNFQLQIAGATLTQPIENQLLSSNLALASQIETSATFVSKGNTTSLDLHDLKPWTFHPLAEEQDLPLPGKLSTHLGIINTDKLVGTITNTLPTDLNDVYIVLPHGFARLGHLMAGETLQVELPIFNSPLAEKKNLADQLAQQGSLSATYFPYTQNQQPFTDFQRHMALLSALEGTGYFYLPCDGSCTNHTIINRGFIFSTGGHTPGVGIHNASDPLLLPGASATLIGWADRPLASPDAVTINGSLPAGYHDSFIQMPLDIDMSHSSHLPPDFITGHIVDTTSYDVQALLPNVYSLSVGSVTFEIPVPNSATHNSFTLIQPDLIAHPAGPNPNDTNVSNLKASLYNWQTSAWDPITFRQDTFSSTQIEAYSGPGERLLLQITTQNKATIYFGQPSLDLSNTTG